MPDNEKLKFIEFALQTFKSSYSQNIQDLWGIWENMDSFDSGYFVEFGALGGINVSNSFLMERLNWSGIVAEPHPAYVKPLQRNRTCNISFDAVYSESNKQLEFKIFKGFPARSTLKEFERLDDVESEDKRSSYQEIIVNTISLVDLLDSYKAPKYINYISIDTEGSEYELLKVFDFNKYRFRCICVEYGSEENRALIYNLLTEKGYARKWEEISDHDDWYIDANAPTLSQGDLNTKIQKIGEFEHEMMARAKKRNEMKLNKLKTSSNAALNPNKSKGLAYRMKLSLTCKDCDYIPKVENAGDVIEMDGKNVQIMHNGVKVYANGYIGPWMTNLITEMKGHHEPQEEAVFYELMKLIKKDKPSMIEFGCYWAYYTCWFKSLYPNGLAMCAEPHSKNLEIGRKNVELNGFDNVHFNHAFAGKYSRVKRLIENDEDDVFSDQFLTVADMFEKHNLEQLDLLHLDIQGAETDVLEDCIDLFKSKKIRFVIVSTHVHYISGDPLTHQKCLETLKSCGARIIVEHDVHESFSGDGMISACFDDSVTLPEMNISYCRYSESFYRNPLYDLV